MTPSIEKEEFCIIILRIDFNKKRSNASNHDDVDLLNRCTKVVYDVNKLSTKRMFQFTSIINLTKKTNDLKIFYSKYIMEKL